MSDTEHRIKPQTNIEIKNRLIVIEEEDGVKYYIAESVTLKYKKKRESFTPNSINYSTMKSRRRGIK